MLSLYEQIPSAWRQFTGLEDETAPLAELGRFLEDEWRTATVHPPREQIFRCLELTAPDRVKAVLLGQDPYHGRGQAEGLCFSVPEGIPPPPSLRNIFKELRSDLGHPPPCGGSLVPWARAGVLLLNTVLTVREGQASAHAGKGWETFTDRIIAALDRHASRPLVFILWGGHAGRKAELVDTARHQIIGSAHPSPLSAHRGFFGSRPFSRTNAFLTMSGTAPVDWGLPCQRELDFG